MHACMSTWVLVMTSAAVGVLGASLNAKPMTSSRNGHHVLPSPLRQLNRQSRSLMDGIDACFGVGRLTDMKHRFTAQLDKNNDGKATFEETKEYIRKLNDNAKDKLVESFIARRDIDGDGVIDFVPDYVQYFVQNNSEEGAREWFEIQDYDEDGFLSVPELIRQGTARGMSPEEAARDVKMYYMDFDENRDNQLSFDEFKKLFS